MALIEAQNTDVSHGARHAVHGVSLTLEAGEIVTIVGHNGSGKSTLMRALVGAIAPSKGWIVPQKRFAHRLCAAKAAC